MTNGDLDVAASGESGVKVKMVILYIECLLHVLLGSKKHIKLTYILSFPSFEGRDFRRYHGTVAENGKSNLK